MDFDNSKTGSCRWGDDFEMDFTHVHLHLCAREQLVSMYRGGGSATFPTKSRLFGWIRLRNREVSNRC